MRKAGAYFGLDGSATRQDWLRGAAEVLPPLLVSALAAVLDGVEGLAGWGLWLAYSVAAWLVWLPLVLRFAPWRRS